MPPALDYAAWSRRAVEFMEGLRGLPGEKKVEIDIAPPMPMAEIERLTEGSRLGIPVPLRKFLSEVSAHWICKFWWEPPPDLQPQLQAILSDKGDVFPGGGEFCKVEETVALQECFLDWADEFKHEYPRDSRFWRSTLPFYHVGNGDYFGLYVANERENPPVVYLCHDGCGGSMLLAPSFDEFLIAWEQVCYVAGWLTIEFKNPKTEFVDPVAHSVKIEILRELLRGGHGNKPIRFPPSPTEADWLKSTDLLVLDKILKADQKTERKQRLLCCACCRRQWDRLDELSRRAVETGEGFVEGLRGRENLDAVLDELIAWLRSGEFDVGRSAATACVCAIPSNWGAATAITSGLDELEYRSEEAAQAELFRDIFPNPFRPVQVNPDWLSRPVVRLVERIYDQRAFNRIPELADALEEAGCTNADILAHCRGPGPHVLGCWVVDLILGRS